MTDATLSLSQCPADDSVSHNDLVQRLNAMTVVAASDSSTTTPSATSHAMGRSNATPPTTSAFHQLPALQSFSFQEHAESENTGEISTLTRQISNTSDDSLSSRRPTTPRSQTDPSANISSFHRPHTRNRSPYARTCSSSPSAPPMTRAHSLPIAMHSASHLTLSPSPLPLARPASPLRSPKRTRSPRGIDSRPLSSGSQDRYGSGIRATSLGSFEGAPSVCDISEDSELELTPRAGLGVSSLYSSTGSLSRRRRPASPLYQVSVPFGAPPTSTPAVSTPTSGTSSPLLAPSKFNEHYPSSFASSSIPSTPTSLRSRSPSISSLETIEDSPDAEEEAIEADRIARLTAAADQEDSGERRSSLDVPEGRGRSLGFGKRDSRKRWSVCGAERRGDLDLETIWED